MMYEDLFIEIDNIKVMQVNKRRARNDFDKGFKIFLHPNAMILDSPWSTPFVVNRETNDESFDTLVSHFECYNCSGSLGRYSLFFTTNL